MWEETVVKSRVRADAAAAVFDIGKREDQPPPEVE